MDLAPEERRVLACLVEKELTTPQQYPLTLNALVAACNQLSNRNPVVDYTELAVESALARLKDRRLVRFVHPSHGRSAVRYRQVLGDLLGLDNRQVALLAVLALRGPQTVGELRGRTERVAPFTDLEDVERELESLVRRDPALVARLPREPGRKEIRYTDLLGEPDPAGTSAPATAPATAPAAAPAADAEPTEPLAPTGSDRGWDAEPEPPPAWREELEELRAEVAALRRDLDELRDLLGP